MVSGVRLDDVDGSEEAREVMRKRVGAWAGKGKIAAERGIGGGRGAGGRDKRPLAGSGQAPRSQPDPNDKASRGDSS